MRLLDLRIEYGLTQDAASSIIGVPVRTYRRYESDDNYGSDFKRKAFIEILNNNCAITEDKGLLKVDQIKSKITELFNNEYNNEIEFCYLFGSYAKGIAKDNSDVDLYVSTNISGLRFVGLIERIREVLHKRVDLIRTSELVNNTHLFNEILKDGIKIYGEQK